jgi:3-oxoacyl-[acyl-carrier protein] reductase
MGTRGGSGQAIYGASKAAVAGLARAAAKELGPVGIRVNAVAPGYVGTGWFEKRLGAEGLERLNQNIASRLPMGFAAGPDDIAGPIVQLLDPIARAITGEVTLLDAGGHLDLALTRRPGKEG